VREDQAKLVAGSTQSEHQVWEFSRDPEGSLSIYKRAADGMWQRMEFNRETNRWNRSGERGLRIGERDKYVDPCF
jgi:hypothetical protein